MVKKTLCKLNDSKIRTAALILMAVAWLLLGFNSDNVPIYDEYFWIFVCSIASGSALALARWNSQHALSVYCLTVIIVGTLRSLAYLLEANSFGPGLVWLILTGTTAIAWSYIHKEEV